MATAVVNKKVLAPARTIPAVIEETVNITLTKDEAEIIAALLGACSVRGLSYGLYDTFYKAGIPGVSHRIVNDDGSLRKTLKVVKA